MSEPKAELLAIAGQALELAKRFGARDADVVASRSIEFEVKVADGSIVTLTQAGAKGLGLRVFVDGRLGFTTTSDFTPDGLSGAVRRAVEMARETASDPYNRLADAEPGEIVAGEELELYDPAIPALSADDKIRWAHEIEAAARAVDPRVRKFRDSGVSTGEATSLLVTSAGAVRTSRGTAISLWSNPIAEERGELSSEVWYDTRTHLADLESPSVIGRIAGQRALRMLGGRPVKTQEVPVVFEPQVAAGLLSSILGAIDGDMVYKKASFLCDQLGQTIAARKLTLIDDPLLKRGSGTSPFDDEGLRTYAKRVIDRGVLTTFLYDSYTARKAGVTPTANARRGYASLPSAGAFNLYVQRGEDDPQEMVRSLERGLIVTRGLGRGLSTVSGEYSRGANGLWVERGEIVHPVQEVTIAGDYLTMLKNIDRVGSDLRMFGATGAPTLRVAAMMLSGA